MDPSFIYEHNQKQTYHLKFLHKDILTAQNSIVAQIIFDKSFPFLASFTFFSVIVHDIVCVEFNHLLQSNDYEIRLLEKLEDFRQICKFLRLGSVDIPSQNRNLKRYLIFVTKYRLVILMIKDCV